MDFSLVITVWEIAVVLLEVMWLTVLSFTVVIDDAIIVIGNVVISSVVIDDATVVIGDIVI